MGSQFACEKCDCMEIPREGARFCSSCGHLSEGHREVAAAPLAASSPPVAAPEAEGEPLPAAAPPPQVALHRGTQDATPPPREPAPRPGHEAVGPPAGPFRLGAPINGLPLELWIVVGLFAVPGAYFIYVSLKALPDTLSLFGSNAFLDKFAFVLLILIAVIAALGVALLAIAWMMYKLDRVGRGLAYVVVACVTAAVLFNGQKSTGQVLSMLAAFAAAAVLGFAPAVKAAFTGPKAPTRAQPTSVVVARVSLLVLAGLLALYGVLYFLLTDIHGGYAALGLALLGLAVGAYLISKRLERPDSKARAIVTAGAVVGIILLLIGESFSGFVMAIGLLGSIPAALWLMPDARGWYGDPPLGNPTPTAGQQ